MSFFDKTKKLSHAQFKEIAAFCGVAALLLLVGGFIASGGMGRVGQSVATNGISPTSLVASIFPCSYFGDCSTFSTYYGMNASPLTVTAGQSVTLSWAAYNGNNNIPHCSTAQPLGSTYCDPDLGCSRQNDCWINPSAATGISGASIQVGGPRALTGSITVHPTQTTTYTFCSYYYQNKSVNGVYSLPCSNATVTVTSVPTTLTSFTATPASVSSGGTSVLSWAGVRGANFNACMLAGGQWGTGTWVTGSIPNTTGTASITATTQYSVQCYDNTYGWVGPLYATVSVPPAPVTADASSNSPRNVGQTATISFYADSATPPTNCQINNSSGTALYQVATCPSSAHASYTTPAFTAAGNYTYQFWYMQNGSWVQAKTVTVAVSVPACANGLGSSYQPSCTCPSGQIQSGASCVAAPLCSNGLADSYAPSCACPSGKYQPLGSSQCVALPVCANGLDQSYSPSCTCPANQVQKGTSCVQKGAINSFTATPSRVLAGKNVSVSWSTSNMNSCQLTALNTTNTSSLSTALSSTITVAVQSKTIFTLTCTDEGGTVSAPSVTVNLIPQTIEQ